ncbi:MAG: hypothetical protein IAE66_03615 [Xanthomonadaceae bacterium]|nr:hypothetical protein [Xanthomonadaceae bacterium]
MRLLPIYRVTVFVPPAHADALVAGILKADGLKLGDYSEVMWITPGGQEQFRPGGKAKPTLGVPGELTRADTVRIEFAIARDEGRLAHVLREGVHRHHPWEVPSVFVDESMFPLPDGVA